jgi:hypothetical protein
MDRRDDAVGAAPRASARADDDDAPASAAPSPASVAILRGAGLFYIGFGALLGAVSAWGGFASSLFPTGWLFPALLLVSGPLMVARRRFDIVATLWAAFTLAVFVLGALVYTNALDHGLDDAAAFDSTLIAAGFGLLVLILRPAFRR